MLLFNSFLYCGFVCMIAQIILDNSKLSTGHITSIFVCIGAFLDTFNIYDYIVRIVGGGALLPIISFGHSLVHGAIIRSHANGIIGLLMGMFDMTATGITASIIFAFVFSLIFKPKN